MAAMRDRRMLSLLRGFDFETGTCFAGFDSLLRRSSIVPRSNGSSIRPPGESGTSICFWRLAIIGAENRVGPCIDEKKWRKETLILPNTPTDSSTLCLPDALSIGFTASSARRFRHFILLLESGNHWTREPPRTTYR